MTDLYIEPKVVLSDFLRRHLVDPRGRAEAVTTETFSGDGLTTIFSLSPPTGGVNAVTVVSVAGNPLVKWKDYYWDYANRRIVFITAPVTGVDNIDIEYKFGGPQWIFTDIPEVSTIQDFEQYPRISVIPVSGPGKRIGVVNEGVSAQVLYDMSFQIDVWVKGPDSVFTIGDYKLSKARLAGYLVREIKRVLNIFAVRMIPFFDYQILDESQVTFEDGWRGYHKYLEVNFKAFDVERMGVGI